MKRILVVISSYRWGGINRSLQSLLAMIDPQEYDVDIFVTVHSGNYDNSFKNCRVLPKNRFLASLLDQKEYQTGLNRPLFVVLKGLNLVTKGKFQHWLYDVVGNQLVKKKKYDAVIAWGEGVPTVFASHINHGNKIAWIHCDYTQYASGPYEKPYYDMFKSIVCVSKYTRQTFLSYFPEMENKVYAIYNILDVDEIRRKAEEPMDVEYDKSVFNIVSVGRVAPVKRFSAIPSIAKKLVDAGCKFKWYIVGPYSEGDEYRKIVEDTKAFGLEDKVIMLGGKENPYPYIANADLYVCTSLSESWSYTVNEAKVLGVPSVSTDFGAIYESIEDGVDGRISPISNIHAPIIDMQSNLDVYDRIISAVRMSSYNNDIILNQINQLI